MAGSSCARRRWQPGSQLPLHSSTCRRRALVSPYRSRRHSRMCTESRERALAYVRARGADPKSSFGDFAAISDTVDVATAELLKGVVSDGIIAPGFEPEALRILKEKRNGSFVVIVADAGVAPPKRETRQLFGMQMVQNRNDHQVTEADLAEVVCGTLTPEAK